MARRIAPILFAAAVGLSVAAYANSLPNAFHFDDGHSIQDNAWLRDLRHVPRYFWDVSTFSPLAENRSFRPVLLVGFALSHGLGGGEPWAYRLFSIGLHAFAAGVIGLLTARLWRAAQANGDDPPAQAQVAHGHRGPLIAGLAAAAVMAAHPLATETVNYVSARSSLQAAALLFACLLLYVQSREDRHRPTLAASAAVLLLAMATKIIAVTAPALAVLWALTLGPERGRGSRASAPPTGLVRYRALALSVLPLAAVGFGFAAFHEWMVGDQARAARSSIAPYSFLLTETRVWMRYQRLFVWPSDLCADLTMRWSQTVLEPAVLGAIAWAAAWGGAALILWRRRPLFTFGILWFYIALSPTNSFVPLSEPASEHRVYIALPGLIWAAMGLIGPSVARAAQTRRRRLVLGAAGVGLLVALTTATAARNRAWRDGQSLWGSVLECSPNNGRAHLNYGRARMMSGDHAAAEAAFARCQSLLPNWIFCRINQAALALSRHRLQEAESHMAVARRLQPDNVYTLTWSGKTYLAGGAHAAAERAFRGALRVAPGYVVAERGLARALFALGKDEAANRRWTALETRGELDAEAWLGWGALAERNGHRQAARRRYRQALRLAPAYPDAARALERLAP